MSQGFKSWKGRIINERACTDYLSNVSFTFCEVTTTWDFWLTMPRSILYPTTTYCLYSPVRNFTGRYHWDKRNEKQQWKKKKKKKQKQRLVLEYPSPSPFHHHLHHHHFPLKFFQFSITSQKPFGDIEFPWRNRPLLPHWCVGCGLRGWVWVEGWRLYHWLARRTWTITKIYFPYRLTSAFRVERMNVILFSPNLYHATASI